MENSFGRLSMNPDMVVDRTGPFMLKEIDDDPFQFHHRQSIDYLENTLGVRTDGSDYFIIHVNAPLHLKKSPKVQLAGA